MSSAVNPPLAAAQCKGTTIMERRLKQLARGEILKSPSPRRNNSTCMRRSEGFESGINNTAGSRPRREAVFAPSLTTICRRSGRLYSLQCFHNGGQPAAC
ncbi:hypothetical protein EVAR_48416_1 [Eumeta japonica]|uniref:Uncharacterized protein n=1 Tax=Eumeta variegata TaxID=151549 RepID=A0A4C1XT54_EUMVA|nr:hypothetical protein EVAR_48416_1 [Eumeta japonica]